ncbi:MAG: GNAT family protein [Pseudomonadota bacterium]
MRHDGPLSEWRGLRFQPATALSGRYARLERLRVEDHAEAIHRANLADHGIWRFLPYGPFPSLDAYAAWAIQAEASDDPAFYAVRDVAGTWSGVASLMRIDRANGVIEIGHINYAIALQRTRTATEALHLMMDHAFAAGFRRLEWKCNAQNAASRRAALRLGFTYEGTFRQHMVVKGANRDTAWFAITDGDWPAIKRAHLDWLHPDNFDGERQRMSLSDRVGAVTGGGVAGVDGAGFGPADG